MSLHFKCPHNDTVYCNRGYELNEYYRQLNSAMISGKYASHHIDDNHTCQVPNEQACPMYRNAMLHTIQNKKVNTGK